MHERSFSLFSARLGELLLGVAAELCAEFGQHKLAGVDKDDTHLVWGELR